jgi:hypothetical protein
MANGGIVARVRGSELEAQIKTFYSFSKMKTPALKLSEGQTENSSFLFTILGLSFCDFCVALILLSEQALSNC